MNNLYFFILGQNPTLSSSEISKQIKGRIIELTNNFLILESNQKLNYSFLQKKLGGTIKIGEALSQVNINNITENIDLSIFKDSLSKISINLKKIYFGFSVYQPKLPNNNLSYQIKKWAMEIKNYLKKKGFSSRWVISKEEVLSSVVITKNRLLNNGAEFVFLISGHRSYLGRTLSCQDFEKYSQYDFGRPNRLIEHGMIPPKLAKIMINLANISEEKTILDPFCGSGTIIQEATLMGYENIIGTDISEEAIKNSQKNIKWLLEKSKNHDSKSKIKIFQTDVRNLSLKIKEKSIDLIVTEPYLGPIKNLNIKSEIFNIQSELSNLYLDAFRQFKMILKSNGKIVIIFPVLKINNQLHFLPILDELKKSNWQMINPIPPELKKSPVIRLTQRGSIIYSRPDQHVLREIFIFTPTSS